VAGSHKYCNKSAGFINDGEYLCHLAGFKLLKEDPVPWS
jgi:hypothetical protein